jgi:hypothetical protein
MPDNTSRREIQGRSSVGLPTKTISMRDTGKVFGGTPGKDYRREIQGMSSVGRLAKSIEERYRKAFRWMSYKRISKRDTGKVFGKSLTKRSKRYTGKVFDGILDKDYRREILKRPLVGYLTKSIAKRYREILRCTLIFQGCAVHIQCT